ncbi:MAG: Fe-S cluster assembly protein SufD [Pseudomonadales bacterium]|nr:Fe-S cluster assembly protein SufD [Pseudomonadales bacterium]
MANWLESAVARAESGDLVNDCFVGKRRQALTLLKQQAWPTRKVEAWKYTSLYPLQDKTFTIEASNDTAALSTVIDGLESIDLIFINGALQNIPSELPVGLSIASVNDSAEAWAVETYSSIKPERHLFGLVNDVLASDTVIIDVAANASIDRPVRIVNVLSAGHESHSRVLVRLGNNAKASFIEQAIGNESSFHTAFVEYDLGAEAELEHYRFALQTQDAMAVGGCHFNLATKAQLNSTLVGFGSVLSRLDVDVIHAGEYTHAKINAIYLLDNQEIFDLHTVIEHAMPNGSSEENVHGIVADQSTAVFNGRIHIHRDAQKVLAEMNNRNLLLSREATINTKPELEIYADDVRCAHGVTIAEMDKTALFYLQSRGVSLAQAQVMLNFGFINELVDQMPNQILAQWLRPQLRERFAQMEVK